MTLDELRTLKEAGQLHHATYRDIGTIWEGLNIYAKDDGETGFRGYRHIGRFGKENPDLPAAHEIVRTTGVSVGSYGEG